MVKLKKFLKIFLSSQLILLQVSMTLSEGQTRIVGGTPSNLAEVTYMAQIFKNGRFHCAGSLVTEQHILTAAHCLKNIPPESFTVVVGASKLTHHGIRSRVINTVIPGDYNPRTYDCDIGVMKLSAPIKVASIQRPAECDTPWKHGDEVKLYGWGKKMDYTDYTSVDLHTTTVNIVDKDQCSKVFSRITNITKSMFCAAAPGKSSCNGDSGGPVLVNKKLCGVVSWGVACGRTGLPAVFTSIPDSKNFLNLALQI